MAVPSECHVVLGLLLTISSCILICCGQNLNASFVFGDSLVDTGNNNYIVSLSKADYLPNGIDFLPSRQSTGRFTNGRTVVDIIGQELGLQKFMPPYLAPSTVGPVVLNGVNYASGGGGILNATGKIFGGRINLNVQIDNYANTRQDIISSLGMPSALGLLRTSLFSVTIGSNDFLDNYLTPVLSAPQRATTPPEMLIDALISNYELQLTVILRSKALSASIDSSSKAGVKISEFNFEAVEGLPKALDMSKALGRVDDTGTSLVVSTKDGLGEPLIGLKLGKRTYFEDVCAGNSKNSSSSTSLVPSTTVIKKTRVSHQSVPNSRCQVEGCNIDLSLSKDYHRKHRVCKSHSKSPMVVVAGQELRFCQQCSSHLQGMFNRTIKLLGKPNEEYCAWILDLEKWGEGAGC